MKLESQLRARKRLFGGARQRTPGNDASHAQNAKRSAKRKTTQRARNEQRVYDESTQVQIRTRYARREASTR